MLKLPFNPDKEATSQEREEIINAIHDLADSNGDDSGGDDDDDDCDDPDGICDDEEDDGDDDENW